LWSHLAFAGLLYAQPQPARAARHAQISSAISHFSFPNEHIYFLFLKIKETPVVKHVLLDKHRHFPIKTYSIYKQSKDGKILTFIMPKTIIKR
jgi:hypothetical protein